MIERSARFILLLNLFGCLGCCENSLLKLLAHFFTSDVSVSSNLMLMFPVYDCGLDRCLMVVQSFLLLGLQVSKYLIYFSLACSFINRVICLFKRGIRGSLGLACLSSSLSSASIAADVGKLGRICG